VRTGRVQETGSLSFLNSSKEKETMDLWREGPRTLKKGTNLENVVASTAWLGISIVRRIRTLSEIAVEDSLIGHKLGRQPKIISTRGHILLSPKKKEKFNLRQLHEGGKNWGLSFDETLSSSGAIT